MEIPTRVAERLLSNYSKDSRGCWISNYSVGSHGYSQIGWQDSGARFLVLGHRASWAIHRGNIPDGMTVDHICHSRKCINPEHLRLLTNLENAKRNEPEDNHQLGWLCKRNHGKDGFRTVMRKYKSGKYKEALVCDSCLRINRLAAYIRSQVKNNK